MLTSSRDGLARLNRSDSGYTHSPQGRAISATDGYSSALSAIDRAKLFDSPACRSAITRTGRDALFWASRCATNTLGGQVSQEIVSGIGWPDKRRVVYMRNQKAASHVLYRGFAAIMSVGQVERRRVRQYDGGGEMDDFIFTVVGDPLNTTISVSTERGTQSSNVHLCPPLTTILSAQAYLEVERRAKRPIDDCASREEATARFVRFLELILQPNARYELGHARARELFHVIPQALKIEHIVSRRSEANDGRGDDAIVRYDAIFDIDHMVRDIALLRAELGKGPIDAQLLQPSRSHSLRKKSCGELIARDDARVKVKFCDLYAADHACLGGVRLCEEGPPTQYQR